MLLLLTIPYLFVSTYEVRYTAEFSQLDISFNTLDIYDVIYMKKTSTTYELGEPVLPVKNLAIAIPRGTRAIKVEAISLGSIILQGEFYVLPGQPPIPIGEERDIYITEKPDVIIYNSDKAYPGILASLGQQSNLAGQEIVWVTIYPLQYTPVERRLVLHNYVEVVVFCETANIEQEHYYKFTDNQRRTYEKMLKELVVNPYAVSVNPYKGNPSFIVPPGNFDHVIITSSGLSSYFDPLVQWHTKNGLKDTVVTTDWIYANYSGPGDTTKIRQFIMDANANWGTMYFLLGGENNIVPFAQRFYYVQSDVPSDQYYSDFDDDWTHEVFVGRASVDDQTQITTFIDKVLKYEKDPPLINYPVDVLLVGMDLDTITSDGEQLMEGIEEYVTDFNIHKVYDSHAGNHKDSVLAYLSAGQNLVAHADHSNYTVMGVGYVNHGWTINNTNVDNLTNNNETCIVTSIGCEPNGFDYNDCISEHFVIYNPNQAGVAFIGNTRHGWGMSGYPGSLSGELVGWWWDGVFAEGLDNIGKAFNYSKHKFWGSHDVYKHCEWTFNLLGEPAMTIWTNTPDVLEVTHDPIVWAIPDTFMVTVKDNDGITPIEDALVCCWAQNQNPVLYATQYTNTSGQTVFSITPNTPLDTMSITVTKHNYLVYEGSVLIAPASGPYIMAATMIIDDGEDGMVNPGETIDLGMNAWNIGFDQASGVYGILDESDSLVSTGVDSSWYGSIATGDSSLSDPLYEFTVANDCPNGHVIQFDLEFRDVNNSTWISHPELRVYSPYLTYQDVSVIGGVWDNGILDPGEIADLVVTIENEGEAIAENITSTLILSSAGINISDGTSNFGAIAPGATGDNLSDPYEVGASSSIPFGTTVKFSLIIESGVYIDTLDFLLDVGQPPPTDTGYYYAYYSGGPYAQVPVFNWIAIDSTQSTYPGVSLDLDQNQTVVVDLPFTFKYYGVDYNRISICSYGWIAMDSTGSIDFTNTGIPNADGPPAMIAGMWDYLHPGVPDAPGDIYYYYDAGNHRFIVEFFKVDHYPGGNPETFEIILNDPVYYPTPTSDGEIIVQYLLEIQESNNTIGIENASENLGIEYFFNGAYDSLAVPITNSYAIKYTTYAPSPGIEEYEQFGIIPFRSMLNQVYPNPFIQDVTITYQMSHRGEVDLVVYDVSGRLIRKLESDMINSGSYTVMWDGRDNIGHIIPAGIYFILFKIDGYNKVEKIVKIR